MAKGKGTLRTYFGAAGLRDSSGEASDFELEGGGGGGGGTAFLAKILILISVFYCL